MSSESSSAELGGSEPLMVRLRLIGQMEAWTLTSESILPTGRKTRALLAILALSAPRPVLRGRLAEMLWSRRPEEQARASLRQEIHRLLDALGPVGTRILAIHRDHLMLRPGTVWVDVEEVLRASPGKPAALCLLDGDLLEDLDGVDPAFDNWLAAERERLRDRARVLAEQMLRDQADPELAIPAAQQLLSIDRAHEGAWRALMRAYSGRGERGMALQAYERCRAVLADLLDAHPSEDTQRLAAEIRATMPASRANLPAASRFEPPRDPRLAARAGFPLPRGDMPRGDMRGDIRADMRGEVRADTRQFAEPAIAERAPDLAAQARAEPRNHAKGATEPRLGMRQGARLGVLPMLVSGGGEAEQGLAAALAEEITATLARSRFLSLVSSASLARLATPSRDEAMIGRAFGLDYVLDGSLQRGAERLRVSLRLLDLRVGNQIVWAERFDRDNPDLLSLQDEIASAVAARMEPALLAIEAERAAARPDGEAGAGATELMLRALALMARLDRAQFAQAGGLLHQAMEQEPEFAACHGWAAFWQLAMIGQGWARDPAIAAAEAIRLSERAVMLDPQDARALAIAGHVRAVLQRRMQEAMVLHERALTLNPNLALGWSLSGLAQAYAGNTAEAERRVKRAKALAPLDPHAFILDAALATVALLQRDHEAAIAAGREIGQVHPGWADGCKPYLAALGHAGVEGEAAQVRQRLLAIQPMCSIALLAQSQPFQQPEDWAHFADGLRRAGLPD
jgi:DNA-binding SARP family transcriptional activator/TolB-like protein